jgi:site-specific DNA-methyltransferase (adenine-specific)
MKYQILLTDCPWPYFNPKGNLSKYGGTPYKQIPLETLKQLPVPQIAAEDSLLFMWSTLPKLPEALEVMKAWKFRFTTIPFMWLKINPNGLCWTASKDYILDDVTVYQSDIILRGGIYSGLGSYTCGNQELVLMGKRGHPKRIVKNIKQTVIAPRGKHSHKPVEVRDRIVKLMGDVPRIELFATEKADGWDAIGGAIDGLDIHESLQQVIDKND